MKGLLETKTKWIWASVLILLFLPVLTFAQIIPCDGPRGNVCDFGDFIILIQNIINYMLLITGSVAAIMFFYAGFLYITSQGDTGQVSRARGIMTKVAIGIVLMLVAWLIVNTILSVLGVGDPYKLLE